jgi:hypothetical protein
MGATTKNLELLKAQHAAATQGKWIVDKPARARLYGISRYMAPEVARRCISSGADVWAIVTAHNAAPLVHAIVEAALELEQANIDIDRSGRDPRGDVNSAYHREHAAKAALWAALEAFKEAEL